MATWQLDLVLIPRAALKALSKGQMVPEGFQDMNWWKGHAIRSDVLEEATQGLTAIPQWTQSITSWGVEDGNRIDVVRDGNDVEEVVVRLDAREVDESFLARITSLATAADCVFVATTLQVVPPLEGELRALLLDSPARRFVESPEDFLDGLSEG